VYGPAWARNVRRRPVQVATQAGSRESVSSSSAQYRLAAGAAAATAAREGTGGVGGGYAGLGPSAGVVAGGGAGEDPAGASRRLPSFLALEIPTEGRAAKDRL